MGIYHAFQSAKPDPANTPANQAKIWPSDWNADHTHPDFLLGAITCKGANMTPYVVPTVLTEFLGLTIHRWRYDLTYVDQIRLTAAVVQPAVSAIFSTAILRAQWSNDGGATWNNFSLLALGTNPVVPLNVKGVATSGWVALSPTAKAAGDVLIRLAHNAGDGIAGMKLGLVTLHVY